MDENGLELSLGLSCGGLSGKQKGKGSSSDLRAEEDDRGGNKSVSDFKGFLPTGKTKQESSSVSQSDSLKPHENFFSDLSKGNVGTEEEVRIGGSNRRKMLFDEINPQKKHPREPNYSDAQDKPRTSLISMNTEDGSVADNEDVAESEADGSTSKLVSHHNMKEVHGVSDSRVFDMPGRKWSSSEHEYKLGNLAYAGPFSAQSINVVNGAHTVPLRDSNSVSAPGTQSYPPPGLMNLMSGGENERSGIKAMTSGNMPVMLGYSPVQPSMTDKDNSWVLASHAAYAGKAPSPANPCNSSEMAQYGKSGRMAEIASDGKHASEEGSLAPAEEDAKATTDNLFINFTAIKPGMAADLKFGGSGSFPNLPWVSTTGPGPNGRTISGVTYRYSSNQIRIVCACHGSHLSPEEFVRHASEEIVNPESGPGLPPIQNTNNNPAASAQT